MSTGHFQDNRLRPGRETKANAEVGPPNVGSSADDLIPRLSN